LLNFHSEVQQQISDLGLLGLTFTFLVCLLSFDGRQVELMLLVTGDPEYLEHLSMPVNRLLGRPL
jgi:hypothetical protein